MDFLYTQMKTDDIIQDGAFTRKASAEKLAR